MNSKLGAGDVFAVFGVGALIYGVGSWSVPAAWVVAGCILLALSLADATRSGKAKR